MLTARYEVQAVDQEELLYRVTVDDARFPDEAVVRLASVLDGIDGDWQGCFSWPMTLD